MNACKTKTWAGRIVSGLVGAMLLASGVMKLVGGPQLEEGFAHLGLPLSMRIPLGIIEIASVVVYLVPATAVVGAILLTGYMGGAILTHYRLGEPVFVQILIGIAAWAGLWLRDERLRALIPLRSCGGASSCAAQPREASS